MPIAVAGAILILLVAIDAFYTVFSKRGGGWLTNLWTGSIWKLLLFFHRRYPIHDVLSMAGPLLLLSIVFLWYIILVLGWTCVFSGTETSVINTDKQLVTSFHDKMFFVGVTLSTLGYGNMVPSGPPWTYLGNATALSGTVLLTASLSYVLAVLQAGIERRQLATMINSIGPSTEQLIRRAWCGRNRGVLNSHLLAIATQVDNHAHKHVNYPILRYFHTVNWRNAPAPAVLVFSDAVFLASHGIAAAQRPPDSLLHVCAESVANYLDQTKSSAILVSMDEQSNGAAGAEQIPAAISLRVLRRLGFETVDGDRYSKKCRAYCDRRKQLIQLTRDDGWDPSNWPPGGSQTGKDDPERTQITSVAESVG